MENLHIPCGRGREAALGSYLEFFSMTKIP
jgi:hypothetical protein